MVKVNGERAACVLADAPVHKVDKVLSHRVEEGQELAGPGWADHFLVEEEPIRTPFLPVPAW